jgi:hypothetical protein
MTKKTFIRLAEYLKDTGNYCEPFTDKQIEHLSNFCHEQNRNFMRGRWIGYIKGECGSNGGRVKAEK